MCKQELLISFFLLLRVAASECDNCDGTKLERSCVKVDDVMGREIFWRRMMKKTATVTSPEVHLPDAPCGEP